VPERSPLVAGASNHRSWAAFARLLRLVDCGVQTSAEVACTPEAVRAFEFEPSV
jgi:hypothetical protein